MRKILFTLMLVALCIPALAQKITLKSSMPKGEAIRLSIATSDAKVKINTGDGTFKEYDVNDNLNKPAFLPLQASTDSPTIEIEGDVYALVCASMQLTEINCAEATKLMVLDCQNNKNLVLLYCHENQISNLNLGTLANLQLIYCFGNKLENLNLSSATKLVELGCYNNNITSLDISHCTEL